MNLLQIITEYNQNSGGSCGMTIIQLSVTAGVGIASVKVLVEELKKEKKISIREGIHSDLIFPVPN